MMVDRTEAIPLGDANIEVFNKKGSANGFAMVLDMKVIDLLLGNGFLNNSNSCKFSTQRRGIT